MPCVKVLRLGHVSRVYGERRRASVRKYKKSKADNKRYLEWVRLHLDVMNWLNSTRSPNLLAWMDCRRSCKMHNGREFKTSRIDRCRVAQKCEVRVDILQETCAKVCINLNTQILNYCFLDSVYLPHWRIWTQYWRITINKHTDIVGRWATVDQ